MSIWRRVTRGLGAMFHSSAADRDAEDEARHYLEELTAEYIERGLSPEEARRAARLEAGDAPTLRDEVRSSGWEHAVETVAADLRHALRRLRTEPAFAAATVLTLALGIGGVTAIFSAVKPILFEPLPYPDAGRIAAIWEVTPNGQRTAGTFGMYRELAGRSRSFASVAVLRPWQATLTGPDRPERIVGQRVSASYFGVLGVVPALGRGFRPTEDVMNGPNVVLLSHALWRRRFDSDSAIVGRTVTLDDDPYTVIGVMKPTFENVMAPAAELWVPLQYDMSQGRAWGHHLRTVGRLRRGISPDQATSELDAIGPAVLRDLRPETYGADIAFTAIPLREDVTRGVKPALLAILGAVTLLLVIACVNVTNLLLAHALRRRGEFALRSALGAGQGRLVRQLLTESLVLALLGGVAGVLVAAFAVRALIGLSPAGLPRLGAISLDGGVLAFSFAVTTLVGLICGLIPSFQLTGRGLHQTLEQGSHRTVGGDRRTRNALVVGEVALTLVLLVSSGLLLRSLQRLFAVDVGFDTANLLTLQVQVAGRRFDSDNTVHRFFEQALDAVRQVPGVTSATFTSQLPISGDADLYGVRFEPPLPDDPGEPAEVRGTYRYAVSPGYFETMRIPLLRGRVLDRGDRADGPPVVVISESVARRRLPGRDPIGQQLRIGGGPLARVVGVVGDVRQASLGQHPSDAVYMSDRQWFFADPIMSLVVRAENEPAALAGAVQQAVWSIDKSQAIARVATMDDLLATSAAQRRFALTLFEAFALTALLLAAAGLYGVLSVGVAERTQEIGVRAALGATRGAIIGLIVRQGIVLTSLGIAIGLVGAAAATRAIETMLFGVSPMDAVTYGGVIALLAVVAMLASGVPAWRAARVDPTTAIRAE